MARRPLADLAEVAAYLKTNPRHIRALVERKAIPYTKVGRLLRFNLDHIDNWLAQHGSDVAS